MAQSKPVPTDSASSCPPPAWVLVAGTSYDAAPLYYDAASGELAMEIVQEGRLVALPADVEWDLRRQLAEELGAERSALTV